jgi:5'-3' exonuclease
MMLEKQQGMPLSSSKQSIKIQPDPSHLMGFFYRTIRIVENGIKPAYVFDGKPPELKSGVVRTWH